MNLVIKYPASRPSSEVRTIKKWELPEMQADSYDANLRGNVGQFGVINPYVTDGGVWVGTFSSNQMAFPLTTAQLLRIAELQPQDGKALDLKMGWLLYGGVNTWGAPLAGSYSATPNWRNAANVRMITACYAGQPVEIVERRVIRCTFNGVTADVPMSRVRTFAPAEWGQPGSMMLVSVVDAANRYGETPNLNVGRVMLPIWAGGREMWLFDRWLVTAI